MGQARLRNSNVSILGGGAGRISFRKNQRLPTGLFCRGHDVVTQTAPGSQSRDRLASEEPGRLSWAGSATATLHPRVTGFFQ
jgi:hypothetical protein